MNLNRKTIGRSDDCDYIIEDTSNKMSRTHAELVLENGRVYLTDKSQNGIFVNQQKMEANQRRAINPADKVMLLNTYPVEVFALFAENQSQEVNDEHTKVLGAGTISNPIPFKLVGRAQGNPLRIDNSAVSRVHCRVRRISNDRFEIGDMGSSNGTFVNNVKLKPNKIYQFPMNAQVKLGGSVTLDLGKSFGIAPRDSDKTTIGTPVAPPKQTSPISGAQGPPPNQPITPQERIAFAALEAKFKEFEEWQRKPGKLVNTYSIAGTVVGALGLLFIKVAALQINDIVSFIPMVLGGVVGRYLGQKKADQIRDDVSYRDQFLVDYACPRCQHSFQTQPWVTIRQCNKCRINFK